MSGFLLCWHRREPPDAASRAVAAKRLVHRGPQGLTRHDGADAFAVHARFEDAIGAEDGLPLVADDWIVAADLRLDDRDRLRSRLRDADAAPSSDASDAELLLASLRTWGDDAPRYLLGDFSFAALDRRRRVLVAARSIFGVKGLFFVESPAFVACSNDLDALCALPGVDTAPDEAAVLEFLHTGGPFHVERTARRGVSRVAPAGTVTWTVGGRARLRRHRELPVPSRLRLISDDEYVASFRELLDAAVADRLRMPAAAMLLSGGLDSPSLAASAARARHGVLRLALTVSTEPLLPDDESRLASAVAKRLGLPHEVMPALPAEALAHCDDQALRTPEPVDSAQFLVWRRQVARLAAAAPVAMHGEDGDALLAPPDLVTMLRTLPPLEIARRWLSYIVRHGSAPWSGMRRSLESAARRAEREALAWRAPSWLRPGVASRHAPIGPSSVESHRTRPQSAGALLSPDWEAFTSMLDAGTSGVAHSFVLPLLDLRLIEYVFAIPPVPWAQKKWMLRRGFAGTLPDEVLRRPKSPLRGFNEALVRRWRAGGGARRPLPVPVDEWVDVRAWREVLEQSPDAERVLEAWRVFELSRWLAQRGSA